MKKMILILSLVMLSQTFAGSINLGTTIEGGLEVYNLFNDQHAELANPHCLKSGIRYIPKHDLRLAAGHFVNSIVIGEWENEEKAASLGIYKIILMYKTRDGLDAGAESFGCHKK